VRVSKKTAHEKSLEKTMALEKIASLPFFTFYLSIALYYVGQQIEEKIKTKNEQNGVTSKTVQHVINIRYR